MKKLLIVVYCLFIACLTATAIFASRTFDGDVENAYEKGMQYPLDLALIEELGWQFSVIEHPVNQGRESQVELLVSTRNGAVVQGAMVTMEISRATKLGEILHPQVTEIEDGYYGATVKPLFYGHYQVDTRITLNGKSVPYRFRIYVDKAELSSLPAQTKLMPSESHRNGLAYLRYKKEKA